MSPRVLSIQSHVVHGHVGNKAATFPLQLLGLNVDPLNTVQFSNHTGYPAFTGQRTEGPIVHDLINGLEANGILDQYTHLLTGYLGRESVLQAVIEIARKLKSRDSGRRLVFLMDPVLGDNNTLYVPKELVPIYRDHLCQLADIITPNSFEAELLTGLNIKSKEDIWGALRVLHSLGPPSVVITSIDLDPNSPTLTLFASHSPSNLKFSIEFPKLSGNFTGTGDLFAALLLTRIENSGDGVSGKSLLKSCELAVATMHHVLKETAELANAANSNDKSSMSRKELRIIESKKWIENPEVRFNAIIEEDGF
ncbi:hypothetical protein HDU83_006272 [Entophlyctis luteolus]|nr:hypothetical protein HDU83_006272 [Entophlyctis luteolus]